jgi:uncharacterized protein (TIGR00304 family)
MNLQMDMQTSLLVAGVALIAIGILIILSSLRSQDQHEKSRCEKSPGREELDCEEFEDQRTSSEPGISSEVKGGAVIFIGPIPIILGSDSRTAIVIMLLAVVLMLVWLAIQRSI